MLVFVCGCRGVILPCLEDERPSAGSQADRSMAYASKLDDFESFVAHAKLAVLTLCPSSASLAASACDAEPGPSSQQVLGVCCSLS